MSSKVHLPRYVLGYVIAQDVSAVALDDCYLVFTTKTYELFDCRDIFLALTH
jgi:hypothetical protein